MVSEIETKIWSRKRKRDGRKAEKAGVGKSASEFSDLPAVLRGPIKFRDFFVLDRIAGYTFHQRRPLSFIFNPQYTIHAAFCSLSQASSLFLSFSSPCWFLPRYISPRTSHTANVFFSLHLIASLSLSLSRSFALSFLSFALPFLLSLFPASSRS